MQLLCWRSTGVLDMVGVIDPEMFENRCKIATGVPQRHSYEPQSHMRALKSKQEYSMKDSGDRASRLAVAVAASAKPSGLNRR